jgi:hypothetical protein
MGKKRRESGEFDFFETEFQIGKQTRRYGEPGNPRES